MVRVILFFLCLGAAMLLSAGDKVPWNGRLFLLRSGQSSPGSDMPLTETGKKQAQLAGKYLKKLGFHGAVYASGSRRTMETAEIAAAELGAKVRMLPELRKQSSQETLKAAGKRVKKALKDIDPPQFCDILFVTHGALLQGAHLVLRQRSTPEKWPRENWNCSLSEYVFRGDETIRTKRFWDASFLPEELITSDSYHFSPEQKALFAVDFNFSAAEQLIPGNRVVYYRNFSIRPLTLRWSLAPQQQSWNYARWTFSSSQTTRSLEIDPAAPMTVWNSPEFVSSRLIEMPPAILAGAKGTRIRQEGRSTSGNLMRVENALLRDNAGRRYRVTYTEKLKNANRTFELKAFEKLLAALRFENSPR